MLGFVPSEHTGSLNPSARPPAQPTEMAGGFENLTTLPQNWVHQNVGYT